MNPQIAQDPGTAAKAGPAAIGGSRTKPRLLRLVIALLAAAAVGGGAAAIIYSSKTHGLRERVRQLKVDLQVSDAAVNRRAIEVAKATLDPVQETPLLIFRRTTVAWSDLAPNAREAFGEKIVPRVVGSFATPSRPAGSENSKVRCEAANLTFAAAGEYDLWTTLGAFKVLIVDPNGPADEEILAIGAFVSGNIVHSMADWRLINPNLSCASYLRPDRMLKKFFASDQPLYLHCGYSVEFLNFVLRKMGHKVRRVSLQTADAQPRGHVVSEVYLPGRRSWAMIDPDFGAVVRDKDGRVLSIDEIRALPAADLVPSALCHKTWIKEEYNLRPYMFDFTWMPDKMTDQPTIVAQEYRKILKDYTATVQRFEYDEHFAWIEVRDEPKTQPAGK
jgi:hypothetical protein